MARTRSMDDVKAFFDTAPGGDDTPERVDSVQDAADAPI
jgi:hypothetical protein